MGCEALYVHIVVEGCRRRVEVEEPAPGTMRTQDRPQTGWEDFDDVCLRRVFECQFRVQGCPAFLEGRLLSERQQVRVWKLFLLLPIMFHWLSDGQWGLLANEALRSIEKLLLIREAKQFVRKSAWISVQSQQCLTGAALPTLQELQRRRDQEVVQFLSQEVLEFEPERPVILDISDQPQERSTGFFPRPWPVHARAFENSSG